MNIQALFDRRNAYYFPIILGRWVRDCPPDQVREVVRRLRELKKRGEFMGRPPEHSFDAYMEVVAKNLNIQDFQLLRELSQEWEFAEHLVDNPHIAAPLKRKMMTHYSRRLRQEGGVEHSFRIIEKYLRAGFSLPEEERNKLVETMKARPEHWPRGDMIEANLQTLNHEWEAAYFLLMSSPELTLQQLKALMHHTPAEKTGRITAIIQHPSAGPEVWRKAAEWTHRDEAMTQQDIAAIFVQEEEPLELPEVRQIIIAGGDYPSLLALLDTADQQERRRIITRMFDRFPAAAASEVGEGGKLGNYMDQELTDLAFRRIEGEHRKTMLRRLNLNPEDVPEPETTFEPGQEQSGF